MLPSRNASLPLQVSEVYRKLRITVRYLLGNLHDFDPARDAVPFDQLPSTDRYMLCLLSNALQETHTSYSNYSFFRFFQVCLSCTTLGS